jgi:hypothetical protein
MAGLSVSKEGYRDKIDIKNHYQGNAGEVLLDPVKYLQLILNFV